MLRIARVLAVLCAIAAPVDSARGADKPRRIAIMPFQNVNGGKELDSIGTGIAETLITELGRIPELTLVERSRLNEAQREIKLGQSGAVEASTAQRMGKFLGADGVIVGSFQRSGNVLRVSARVIDVQTAQVRESTSVDGRLDDLLNLQDQLAAKLLEAMKGTLAASDRRRLGASPSTSVDALRAFSDGVAYYKFDLFQDAIASFAKAIALDPHYVDAQYYQGLAYGKLKKWDEAIASFKRTLPTAPAEHTVKWSWDAPFDFVRGGRFAAFPAIQSGAGTLQTLQSPDAVIRARRYVVFLEMSSAAAEIMIVDPVEHRATRLELPEAGASILGLALASDRVVAIPVPTPAALLAGKLPVYGIDAATGSLLWHQDFNTQGGLSFGSFAAGIFWTYNPGTHLLEGFDETTLHKKWERANIAIDTEFPSVRMPQASGEPPLVIAKSTAEHKVHAIRMSDGVDAWSADLQTDETFLVAGDHAVVVFEGDRRVFAVDPVSGKPLIDVALKPSARTRTFGLFGNKPTVPAHLDDTVLYFATDQNEIAVIDIAPGAAAARRPRWKTPPQKAIREIRAFGGRVYATTDAGELLIVDAQSGGVTVAKVGSLPLDLDYAGGDLVLVSSPDAVYGRKPDTGAAQWDYRGPARTRRPVHFKGVVIVQASGTNGVTALEADTGAVLWQYTGGIAGDEMLEDLGANAPKVIFGDDSVFIIAGSGIREYAITGRAAASVSNKEALTELAAAYIEKGEIDEAARFADLVGGEFDPNYPPLRRVRSRIAQARGKPADALRELMTYVNLVGRDSKAGQEILADFKRTHGLLWTAEVGAQFWDVALGDRRLIGANGSDVIALDPATGRSVWRVRGDSLFGSVYDPQSRRFFYAETQNRDRKTVILSAVNTANGEAKEFGRIALPSAATGVITGFAFGRLYFLAYAVRIDVQPQVVHVRAGAFDAASGKRLWERPGDLDLSQTVALRRFGSFFFLKGDSLVYALGRDVLVLGGEDGTVRAQFTADDDVSGRVLKYDDGSEPDLVFFGTPSSSVNAYSISAKQLVIKTNIPNVSPASYNFDSVATLRDGILYDSSQEVFAYDVRKETPDAARLKWRTDIGPDRRLSWIRFVGGNLYANSDNSLVRIDTATGRIIDEYPLLWSGNVVEDGTREYGFTPDGFAFALQLKPVQK